MGRELALLALVIVGAPASGPRPTHASPDGEVLVGAGDIAICGDLRGATATAKLLDQIPGTVFTLGDNACPDGSRAEFRGCYDPTWGRHKARTHPALGNHDYHASGAAPYFEYFGDRVGNAPHGYYSYGLGGWHVVVIDSNCSEAGGCGKGSPQEHWLRADLAAHPSRCTLAYWHHPLFSSGKTDSHARHPEMRPIWEALYDAGAVIVVNGHEHNYERFAPQDPSGRADPKGIREFVVGTGGRAFHALGEPSPNSEARRDDTFGVLKLTLHPSGYDWQFVPAEGGTFTDSGSGTCH